MGMYVVEVGNDEEVQAVRTFVLAPAESVVEEDKSDLSTALPQLIESVARNKTRLLVGADFEAVLQLMEKEDQNIASHTLLALAAMIETWPEHPDCSGLMREYLPRIVAEIVASACEPSHRFSFVELMEIASTLLIFAQSPECPASLFGEEGNAEGLIGAIREALIVRFPNVTEEGIVASSRIIVGCKSREELESAVIELASVAKVSQADEIVNHIRVLKIKAELGIGLFDT